MDGSVGRRQMSTAQGALEVVLAGYFWQRNEARRTLQLDPRIGVLFHSGQFVLVFILVAGFYDVAVGVISRRISLQDVPVVDALGCVSLDPESARD